MLTFIAPQAGLQLTPNSTRLFKVWGIYDALAPVASLPPTLSVWRYDGTKLLAHDASFQTNIHARYQFPFWDVHRADLQSAMAARAAALGVTLRLSAKVVTVNFSSSPSATLDSGEVVSTDVILCADGLWSQIRGQFLGRPSPAILTGDLAYRIVINKADLHGPDADELRAFIEAKGVNFWIGPRTHVVAYTARTGEMFNLVLLCPNDLPEHVVKTESDVEEMRQLFEGWDPLLRKFLGQVKQVAKWKLMWLDTLSEWVNPEGTFVMLGDCCHPMLPYLAQGANTALEDGAVLGALFGKVKFETKAEQLPKMTALYQKLRKERNERMVRETFKQRDDFHLEDGERQEQRDALMISCFGNSLKADFPSRWTCSKVQPWLFGYDAYREVEEGFKADPF
jgi:salicylate hydroxylase